MKTDRSRLLDLLADNGFIAIFAIWCLFLSLFTDNFLTFDNQMTVLRQASIVGIVAIGEALVVLSGAGMDVSLAALLGLCGVVAAGAMVNLGVPAPVAVLLAMALGGSVGLVNGLLATKARINGVVVTIGMMYALEGAAQLYAQGSTIYGPQLAAIRPLALGRVVYIPLPVVLLFGFYAAAHYVLARTVFGARLYATGANRQASLLSGVRVDRVQLAAYVIAGALAGFGGVMQAARLGSAPPAMGGDFLFPILTAVILGGFSLAGGRGRIVNALVASIFLLTISNGLLQLGVAENVQKIVSGAILITALSLDRLRERGR